MIMPNYHLVYSNRSYIIRMSTAEQERVRLVLDPHGPYIPTDVSSVELIVAPNDPLNQPVGSIVCLAHLAYERSILLAPSESEEPITLGASQSPQNA